MYLCIEITSIGELLRHPFLQPRPCSVRHRMDSPGTVGSEIYILSVGVQDVPRSCCLCPPAWVSKWLQRSKQFILLIYSIVLPLLLLLCFTTFCPWWTTTATDERPNNWTNEDRYYWELSHRIFACKIIKRYGGAFAFQEDNNNINKRTILVKPTKETYYCWWHGEIGRTMCVKLWSLSHILMINLLICENLSLI